MRTALANMSAVSQAEHRGSGDGRHGSLRPRPPPPRGGHRRVQTEGGAPGRTSPLSNMFTAQQHRVSFSQDLDQKSASEVGVPGTAASIDQHEGTAAQRAASTSRPVPDGSAHRCSAAGAPPDMSKSGSGARSAAAPGAPVCRSSKSSAGQSEPTAHPPAATARNSPKASAQPERSAPDAAQAARAGALAAIAAARKQALAEQAAQEADRLMRDLDAKAAVTEEAQTQLAEAQLAQEELAESGSAAQRLAAQLRVDQWKASTGAAMETMRSAHSEADCARQAAADAARDAGVATARAEPFVPHTGMSEAADAMQLPTGPAHAAESVHAATEQLQAAWQSELQAAETAVAEAAERKAQAHRTAELLRDQAQIAAQHAQVLHVQGRAADSAAAHAAAQGLVHRAKCAAQDAKGAAAAQRTAQARWDSAQEQLSRIGASQKAWRGDSLKLHALLDAAAAESRRGSERASAARAAADVARLRESVVREQSAHLSQRAATLQKELNAAVLKGDHYAQDALSPELQGILEEAAHVQLTVDQLAQAAKSANEVVIQADSLALANMDREQALQAEAARSAAAAAISIREEWQSFSQATSGTLASAAAAVRNKEAEADALKGQAAQLEATAAEAAVQQRYGDARAAANGSQRLRQQASEVSCRSLRAMHCGMHKH
jgi:hypothetical protein